VKQKKIYADNCLNRNLGRVGKQVERTRYCDENYSERNELIEPFLNIDIMVYFFLSLNNKRKNYNYLIQFFSYPE